MKNKSFRELLQSIAQARKMNNLICPNCDRKVPNKEHYVKGGCRWCILPK